MNSAAGDARNSLKEQTDSLPQSLHHLVVFERLLDELLSLPDDASMMRCYHDFYLDLDEKTLRTCEAFLQILAAPCVLTPHARNALTPVATRHSTVAA